MPTIDIDTVRQARLMGLDRNLPPMVVELTAVDPTAPFCPVAPGAVIANWVPHPVLAAKLNLAGATRRGRATWSVPMGGDEPHPEVFATLFDSVANGTVYAGNGAATTKGPRNLWQHKDRISNGDVVRRTLLGTPAARVVNEFYLAQRTDAAEHRYRVVFDYHPESPNPAAFSGVVVKVENQVGYVQLFSHFPADYAYFPAELRSLFDLRPAGRSARNPKPRRAVDVFEAVEWLTGRGVPVLDPHGVWAALRESVSGGVVAWPQPGMPAKAALTVPARLAANLDEDLVAEFQLVAGSSQVCHGTASAQSLHTLLEALPQATHTVSDSVADVLDMYAAEPYVTADHLYDYQCEVVGTHLATGRGLVVALDPGMGKTVTTLEAWRVKARLHRQFRGLVITEAALRTQWAAEVGRWFPEATVIVSTSGKDADMIADGCNVDGPVVVIVAYSAMRYVADTAARLAWNEKFPLLAEALEAASQEVADPDPVEQVLAGLDDDVEPAAEVADPLPPSQVHPMGEVLLALRWDEMAVDEAEPLRGTGSKAAKGAWALRSRAKVAVVLTGTPINRSVDDLGRLVAFARNEPELFDGVRLSNRFDMSCDADLKALNVALGPTVFRRATSETTGKIPQVNPVVVMLSPSAAEVALDEAARGELKRVYEELVDLMEASADLHPDSEEYAQAAEQLRAARGAWLGGTTLARQAASDPAALLGAHSAAAELLAAQGVIAAATERPGTKRTAAIADITDRVMDGEKVLIFTEFATVARGLIADLDEAGVKVGQVLGGGGKRRDADVAAFQAGRLDALVLTSSGEKGLNLQAATTLVHYDLPWTPKGVLQRTGRARRLASDNDSINVVFYVMRHTIEERVAALVVSRAVEAMRALDTSRGLTVEQTDLGSAFAGLAQAAADTREGRQQSVLMEVTRQLVAAADAPAGV